MSEAKVGVVVFPGSNCEFDCVRAFDSLGAKAQLLWHGDRDLDGADIIVLPGGFAHGDYLRTGAIARFSPVMESVRRHADEGGLVIGICNGFQILCEVGMLPGAMRKNAGLKFMCKWVDLRVDNAETPFTASAQTGDVWRFPINHFEGNWYCDDATLEAMRANDQIVLRYVDNPNGSRDDVAGIVNERRNVLGLMPHPERACEALLGSEDGAKLFNAMIDSVTSSSERSFSAAR